MYIRVLCVVAVCLGYCANTSISVAVYLENKQLAGGKVNKTTVKEELKDTDGSKILPNDDSSLIIPNVHLNLKASSSEESYSQEHNLNKSPESSQSSEDSSVEEISCLRKLKKRSLDSKQDPINTLSEISNQTSSKGNNGLEKEESNLLETNTSSIDILESSLYTTTEYSLVSEVSTDEQLSETTTFKTSSPPSGTSIDGILETTTDTEPETIQSETTTNVESETTTETEPETTPLETESEATTALEDITTSTGTPKGTDSSLDDNEGESSFDASSTPSTEIETKNSEEKSETFMEAAMTRVNKLSDQIRLVLSHYRKDGAVVLPGQNFFPEPMEMQDFQQSFSIGTMNFKNMRVYGLSNFTVEHINTDVDRMQVYILLHMKRLVILGNYTLRTFFSRAAGPFNVTLLNVDSEGVAEVETASEGHLEATDSVMDMFTQDMKVDFKNLGFMGSMFQGMVSAVGDALFNSIKPQILERVNIVIRTDVNKKLKEFSTKFIQKVSPVDLAFSEGRKYAKSNGYDPYNMKDHTFVIGGLVYVNITDFWVEGLSKFYRVGNLSLSMDSGVIQIGVHVLTEKLTGRCSWSGQTFGIVKYGKTNFTIDHLQVRALVNQSLDLRKKPQLEDLDLELGWVKVTMDSPMTLSLMIEGIINAFPRLIRHIIVDTLEQPLKEKIQEILDQINIEAIVDDNLPRLDSFGL